MGKPDEAFDIFHVAHPNAGSPELMQPELDRLRAQHRGAARRAACAPTSCSRGARGRRRGRARARGSRPRSTSTTRRPQRYTIVDVYTRDRAELLHVIARTLHEKGLTIALAKVNTEGQRVADVFYVQTPARR